MLEFDVATACSSTPSLNSSVVGNISTDVSYNDVATIKGETEHDENENTRQPAGALIVCSTKEVDMRRDLISFKKEDLDLGKILGKGGFGVVREVANIPNRLASLSVNQSINQREKEEPGQKRGKLLLRRRFIRHKKRDCYEPPFVVKQVNRDDFITSTPEQYSLAVLDLSIEARMLSALKHPNIIKLWGSSMRSDGTFEEEESNFLVLDRLHDTLDSRIQEWKRLQHKRGKTMSLFKSRKVGENHKRFMKGRMQDRLRVAFHLADALSYIHSQNIIHRDIKTSNIGFDLQGNVKVFDFGLARKLPPEQIGGDDRYKLTGRTGSIRYMAPEVYNNLPYNKTADVYSFSIVLWEMLSLEKAFAMYDNNSRNFVRDVFYMDQRPELPLIKSSESVKNLLRCSWSICIDERPSASDVLAQLQQELPCLSKLGQ